MSEVAYSCCLLRDSDRGSQVYSAMDASAHHTMKDIARRDIHCELQNSMNQ